MPGVAGDRHLLLDRGELQNDLNFGCLPDLESNARNSSFSETLGGHDDVDITRRNAGEGKMSLRVRLRFAFEPSADLDDSHAGHDSSRLRIQDAPTYRRVGAELSASRGRRHHKQQNPQKTDLTCDDHRRLLSRVKGQDEIGDYTSPPI